MQFCVLGSPSVVSGRRREAFGDLAAHEAVAPAARRLEQHRAAATADRIDALLAVGRHDDALGELPRIVEHDPYDERAQGQLMRALVAAGRQVEALATFRAVQDRLRDELGVDPSPELRRRHEEVLRQEVGLPSTRAARPEQAAGPATPDRSDPLLGRETDLATLSTWVRNGSLVTLAGPRWSRQDAAGRGSDGASGCGLAGWDGRLRPTVVWSRGRAARPSMGTRHRAARAGRR